MTFEIDIVGILKLMLAVAGGMIAAFTFIFFVFFGIMKLLGFPKKENKSEICPGIERYHESFNGKLKAIEKQADKISNDIGFLKDKTSSQQGAIETNSRHISEIKGHLGGMANDFRDQTGFLNRITAMMNDIEKNITEHGVTLGTVKTGIDNLLRRA